jgi:hypothetical protein
MVALHAFIIEMHDIPTLAISIAILLLAALLLPYQEPRITKKNI